MTPHNPDTTPFLLRLSLEVAVPLHIHEMKDWSLESLEAVAKGAVDTIASKGDIILYKSPKKGETAAAFNTLARAVAAAAFFPGGVKLFGLHFEAYPERHPPRKPRSP